MGNIFSNKASDNTQISEENRVQLADNGSDGNDGQKSQSKLHQVGLILILATVGVILVGEIYDSDNRVVDKIMNDARNVYETTEIIDKIKSFINLNYERLPALPDSTTKTEDPEIKNSWFQ